MIKRIIIALLLLCSSLTVVAVPVILTAGQSNADGRVPIAKLPDYIHYNYCQWSYGSGDLLKATGTFKPFAPTVGRTDCGDCWGFDAIVYYLLEQYWQQPFYVIKQTMGGTAIDTSCKNSTNGWYWSVDARKKSLLKAFCQQIDDCLAQLPQDVNIKCLLWHQGESDMTAADRYHDNLKAVVSYIRQHLVEKTGRKEYSSLPVICGTFAKGSLMYSPQVTAALYQLACEDKNFYVVDASDLTLQNDLLHFDARGAEKLGRRFFEKMRETGIVADILQDDYHPFIEEGKVWKVGTVSGNPVQMVDHYYFDGDTIIDGKTCKLMMRQRYISPIYEGYDSLSQLPSLGKVGAWYEENGKVYFYDEDKQAMMLKYDFSIGDYESLYLIDDYPPFMIGPKQTGGIEGFNGVYRDLMIGKNTKSTIWLEGVGGIDGPTRNAYPETTDHVPEFLMSCFVDDEVIYLNDEYEDGATPEDLSGENETQTTGIKVIINKKEERRYIYNIQGQRISSLQKGLNIVNRQKIYVK